LLTQASKKKTIVTVMGKTVGTLTS
jgi:hypothetical protein